MPLGRSRSSMFKSLKSFLTLRICLQILLTCKLYNDSVIIFVELMTVISKGGDQSSQSVKPVFWKIDNIFVSKFLSSTCRGIPTTSKYSLLEYWAFAQHWRSIVTILLQSSLFTSLVATSSDWSLVKLSLKLRIFWSIALLSSVILFCNDRTIGIRSLFSILSRASSVYCNMFDIVARWRLGWKV